MRYFLFLLMGVVFIWVGIYSIWSDVKKLNLFRIEGYEVIASITEISKSRDDERAFITYTAAGKEQTVALYYYTSSMRVGDKVKIYVNDADPQDYVYVGTGPIMLCVLMVFMGIVLVITTLQCIIR